jgi:hypothetical protein
MPALTFERIANPSGRRSGIPIFTGGSIGSLLATPVEVEADSIVFRPAAMGIGRFYLAELKGKPYLYRRVSETEIEVYGLAE